VAGAGRDEDRVFDDEHRGEDSGRGKEVGRSDERDGWSPIKHV